MEQAGGIGRIPGAFLQKVRPFQNKPVAGARQGDIEQVFRVDLEIGPAILDEARGLPRTTRGAGRLTEDQIATAVSREASQSRAPKTDAERGALLRDLLACEMPYCCPRGRPTLIQISLPELERKFGLSQG